MKVGMVCGIKLFSWGILMIFLFLVIIFIFVIDNFRIYLVVMIVLIGYVVVLMMCEIENINLVNKK